MYRTRPLREAFDRSHLETIGGRISYMSSGGGAMLKYLEGTVLPGIKAVQGVNRSRRLDACLWMGDTVMILPQFEGDRLYESDFHLPSILCGGVPLRRPEHRAYALGLDGCTDALQATYIHHHPVRIHD